MKKAINLFCLLFFLVALHGQSIFSHHINFILMVDNKIPSNGSVNMHFLDENEDKSTDTVEIHYQPGDIFIKETDFARLQKDEVKSIALYFLYSTLCKNKVRNYYYKISIYKSWLLSDFVIFHIFNMDKSENRKLFFPIKGQQYVCEIDIPGVSIMTVRKGKDKKGCD